MNASGPRILLHFRTSATVAISLLLGACGSDPRAVSVDASGEADAPDVHFDSSADVEADVGVDSGDPDADADAVTGTDTETDPGSDAVEDVRTDPTPDAGPDVEADVRPDRPPPTCDGIPTFEDGLEPMRSLHVSTSGSDETGDGSELNPFGSIGRAASSIEPGNAIVVHEGTYPGGISLDNLRGTADAPIWLGGAEGEARPVLDAAGASQALHIIRGQYLVVHNLEIRNAADNGLNADDGSHYDDPTASHHVLFRDLLIEDIGPTGNRDCLKLSGLNNHFVLDSTFRRCGDGGSAVDHVGCHDGVIARNTFEDLGSSGVQNKGGTQDIDIFWNRFDNAGARPVNMGGSTGLDFFRPPVSAETPNSEATGIRVVANLIIGGETASAFVGCVDCVFAQNTVVNPGAWALRVLQERTSGPEGEFLAARNGEITNNIFYFSRDMLRTFVNVGPDTEVETFRFGNNLWFAHDAPERSTPDLPAPTADDVVGEDPGFDDEYRIGESSPAVGRGATSHARGDLSGRCFEDPPSIGAWEGAGR